MTHLTAALLLAYFFTFVIKRYRRYVFLTSYISCKLLQIDFLYTTYMDNKQPANQPTTTTAIKPQPVLATLPFDLLHAVIAHIPDASSLAALSRTCRTLHQFVARQHGWQIFVQARFPSIYATLSPPEDVAAVAAVAADAKFWQRHAQELTLLSHNFDRRAFVAEVLDPDVLIQKPLRFYAARHTRGDWRGGAAAQGAHWRPAAPQYHRWAAAVQVKDGKQSVGYHPVLHAVGNTLGMGAGQDLLIRRRGGVKEKWWVYADAAHVAGKDDITAMQLFSDADSNGDEARALVGRANGTMSCIRLLTPDATAGGVGSVAVDMSLNTRGQQVRNASMLGDLVSSVLGNDLVALHRLPPEGGGGGGGKVMVDIASEITTWSTEDQPWSTQLLSPGLLAVGKSSEDPLAIYSITPTGLTLLRKYDASGCVGCQTSSVNPIAPFPDIRAKSDVFITGWYTGATLVHDLRSPDLHVAEFFDPIDNSKIYSLLPIGRERIIAGGARHSLLKVFDIRMPGGRAYSSPLHHPSFDANNSSDERTHGWATYLHSSTGNRYTPHRNTRNAVIRESPVYSLASGSPGGGEVLAGVEGGVWEFDFVGRKVGTGEKRAGRRNCVMYEFEKTRMWVQGREELMGRAGIMRATGALDGRWGPL